MRVEPLEAVAERARQEAARVGVDDVGAPGPDGEDERQAGQRAPLLGQIVDVAELALRDRRSAGSPMTTRRACRRRSRPAPTADAPRSAARRASRAARARGCAPASPTCATTDRARRSSSSSSGTSATSSTEPTLLARADAHAGHRDQIALPRQRRDRQERQVALALGEAARALRRRAELQLDVRRRVGDEPRDERPRVEERRRRQAQLLRTPRSRQHLERLALLDRQHGVERRPFGDDVVERVALDRDAPGGADERTSSERVSASGAREPAIL